jgi:hypothetical protein
MIRLPGEKGRAVISVNYQSAHSAASSTSKWPYLEKMTEACINVPDELLDGVCLHAMVKLISILISKRLWAPSLKQQRCEKDFSLSGFLL